MGYKPNVNSYRAYDPQTVIKQIDVLVNTYGVRNIKFADELFVLNSRRVNAICDLIIDRGYNLNVWAYTRVDSIREDMLDHLRRAGIRWMAIGIEAGNERVRAESNKGFDPQKLSNILAQIRAADLYIGANYIFGLPEDDLQTMQETLDLSLEINSEWANFYCAMAYPGSALYQQALEKGLPLPQSWAGYSQLAKDTLPLPTKYINGKDVLAFRDHAFEIYFGSSKYQEMIEKKFGAETRAHIVEMLSNKIIRNP